MTRFTYTEDPCFHLGTLLCLVGIFLSTHAPTIALAFLGGYVTHLSWLELTYLLQSSPSLHIGIWVLSLQTNHLTQSSRSHASLVPAHVLEACLFAACTSPSLVLKSGMQCITIAGAEIWHFFLVPLGFKPMSNHPLLVEALMTSTLLET